MKFLVHFKQIRSVSNPLKANWCEHFEAVETLDMALLYAKATSDQYGTPAKVTTVCGDEYAERLRDKVIAYFGPEEHAVAIDWIEFECEYRQVGVRTFRTDAAGHQIQVKRDDHWNNIVFPTPEMLAAVSKARFAK